MITDPRTTSELRALLREAYAVGDYAQAESIEDVLESRKPGRKLQAAIAQRGLERWANPDA